MRQLHVPTSLASAGKPFVYREVRPPFTESRHARDTLGNRSKIAILRTLRTLFGHSGEFPDNH